MSEVSDVVEFCGTDCDFHAAEDEHQWLLVQARRMVPIGNRYHLIVPSHVIAFSAWPGEECEVANLGLSFYPDTIETEEGISPTDLSGWMWHSFCKTQFASNPDVGGIANFLCCHLAVIRLLDHAQAMGILESVKDEGRFWENRDLKALAETVGQWNTQLAGLAGQFKDQFDGKIIAPITGFPNFEHLEADGRKSERDDRPG